MKSFIKEILPIQLQTKLQAMRVTISRLPLRIVPKSRLLSNLYYCMTDGFSAEHQAVLKGRKAYYESVTKIGSSSALLRRNIHRLEKGLIMRPRRNIFAEGFIRETVVCYSNAIMSEHLCENEKKWATDVLDEYFSTIGFSIVTDRANRIYIDARNSDKRDPESICRVDGARSLFKPYVHDSLPVAQVSFCELEKLFLRRRSVRWYRDDPVPPGLVQRAANIASLAPSACNRQPYRFFFCNNKDKAVAIAKCAGGTAGFADNLPSIIAIVGDLSAYPFERDRHLIYIDGSLAAMQLMLALETLGLSTCSINWPEDDRNERRLRRIVELKEYERVVMLLAVGYADPNGGIPYSQKKINTHILENIS